jgi:hypothetical protein
MMDDANENADPLSEVQKTMAAIEGIVRILAPLSSDERQKIIHGALVVLGESIVERKVGSVRPTDAEEHESEISVPLRARAWIRQNKLSDDQLGHVFDLTGGVATVIASEVFGKNTAEKVVKAYVLTGIASVLSSGEPTISDKGARHLCENLGCYDRTNHTKYLKEKGNYFVGDKDRGWKLTAPGLKFGGSLVRELAGTDDA